MAAASPDERKAGATVVPVGDTAQTKFVAQQRPGAANGARYLQSLKRKPALRAGKRPRLIGLQRARLPSIPRQHPHEHRLATANSFFKDAERLMRE
jgi:hypothetical protein